MRHECAVRPEDLGPYLLGQLTSDEAALVADRVESCASCTVEVQRLRPVVEALARGAVPLDEPAPSAPPPAFDRVLASVHDERLTQRRRFRLRVGLVAAALALVVTAAVGGLLAVGDEDAGGAGRQVALTGASGAAAGQVTLSERGWGSSLVLEVRGLTPGQPYGAWLADRSGERVPAGTFRPTADGSAHLELGASLALSDAGTVGVTEIGGQDVLRGSLAPRAS